MGNTQFWRSFSQKINCASIQSFLFSCPSRFSTSFRNFSPYKSALRFQGPTGGKDFSWSLRYPCRTMSMPCRLKTHLQGLKMYCCLSQMLLRPLFHEKIIDWSDRMMLTLGWAEAISGWHILGNAYRQKFPLWQTLWRFNCSYTYRSQTKTSPSYETDRISSHCSNPKHASMELGLF